MAAPCFLLAPAENGTAKLYPRGLQGLSGGQCNSGVDLPTPQDTVIFPGTVVWVNLGVRAVCLRPAPLNNDQVVPWAYRLVPRSSISKTPLIMVNGEGIIDVGYRGPLIAPVRNLDTAPYTIPAGHALFQLVAVDLTPPEYEVLADTDPRYNQYFGATATTRGTGGFGSTGAAGSAGRVEMKP
jgi:dUTP pyrophosphatase